MTAQPAVKAHVLSDVSLLITTLAIPIALVAPAQLTGSGRLSARPTGVPTTKDASPHPFSCLRCPTPPSRCPRRPHVEVCPPPPLFLPAVTYASGGFGATSVDCRRRERRRQARPG